ncbi:MAG: arylsulfatase [Candidatus Aminicenantes bacterium]|nr:arylsulfatase [Candidatus Aminicenantes bacterium]
MIPGVFPSSKGKATGGTKSKPNVVLIMSDDQGYGDLSCHGNPILKTPNLDKLYSESIRLTNFHVDPTCSPTRSSLLTGRYSSRVGVWHTIMGRSLLRRDEITMADIFLKNGYRTGIFGKWHLGDNCYYHPWDRGFEESLVIGGGAIGNAPDYWGNDYFDDFYCHNGKWEKHNGYCTDVFFNAAIEFIKSVKEPFFVYIPTNVPHWPHNVDGKYVHPYRGKVPDVRATFYGMISNLDENIGRFLNFLKQNRLEENTVVIFLTDNGTSFGASFDKNGFVKEGFNAGMRANKGSVYEGGHRVPCFIRWPGGGISGGKDIRHLSAHIDLLPTLIELCGLRVPVRIDFDGESLVPLLKGKTANWPERTLFVHNQRVDFPIKWKDFAVMTSRWRLVNDELYDISKDPEQRVNVASQYPEVVKKLRQEYESWWQDISERFGEYTPIYVGTDKENPVKLTSHDIHGQVAWDQRHVLKNSRCDGFWVIDVCKDGVYEISVRRWPEEANLPICEAPENGVVFKPTHVRLKVAEFDVTKPVQKGDKAVIFQLPLKKGLTRLQSWFIDDRENGFVNGAFYVYIKQLSSFEL